MTLGRLVTAAGLVALGVSLATLWTVTTGRGGITSLLWAIDLPLLVAGLVDPRRHAWVVTSLWLTMCSFITIIGAAEWQAVCCNCCTRSAMGRFLPSAAGLLSANGSPCHGSPSTETIVPTNGPTWVKRRLS
jgi:hypothetical protein